VKQPQRCARLCRIAAPFNGTLPCHHGASNPEQKAVPLSFLCPGERHTDVQTDSHRWCLTVEQYEQFRQLVNDAQSDNDFGDIWKSASLVYGRV